MGSVYVDDDYTYKGYRLVIVENDYIKIVILPEKGADIYQFIDKKHNADYLWKTPMGLRSQVKPVPAGYGAESQFANTYEGGWQMVFPNGGAACFYKGVNLEMCGDAAVEPWKYRIADPGPDMARVVFETTTHRLPYRLQRVIRVAADKPCMQLDETILNLGREKLDYVWGQHVSFDGALIRKGNWRLDIPCKKLYTNTGSQGAPKQTTPGARKNRLPQNGEFTWPHATGNDGQIIDLSVFPDAEVCACDIAYLHELSQGTFSLINEEKNQGFQLTWNHEQFPYIWYFQNFNGSFGYPWYGRGNGIVLEPITSFPALGLTESINRNNHCVIQAGEKITASFSAQLL